MPVTVKKKSGPGETPFEGGVVVTYEIDDLRHDLATIVQGEAKRKALKEALEKAATELEAFNAALKHHESNVSQYFQSTNTLVDGEPFETFFEGYQIVLGKKTLKRTVTDTSRVHKIMGDEAFYAAVNVPLKAIDDYLTKAEREEVISAEFTGDRKITVKATGGGTVAFSKKKGKV